MNFAASLRSRLAAYGMLTKLFRLLENLCYKLPAKVGLDKSMLVKPIAVAIHYIRLIGMQPG